MVEARSKVVRSRWIHPSWIILPTLRRSKKRRRVSGVLSQAHGGRGKISGPESDQVVSGLASAIGGNGEPDPVARNRYIESVSAYNKVVLLFPSSIGASWRGKEVRPTEETC